MRAPRHQHVDVHLPRESSEHLPVAGRHDLLPVRDAYPERLVRDRERERVMRVLRLAIGGALKQLRCERHRSRWDGGYTARPTWSPLEVPLYPERQQKVEESTPPTEPAGS